MSKHLKFLLINLKGGLKHKKISIRCMKTKLNQDFLCYLISLGVIESFRNCFIYKNRFQVFLNQTDLNYREALKDSNILQSVNLPINTVVSRGETELRLFLKKSPIYKYKKLLGLQKKNNKSYYIFLTSKGFLTVQEMLSYKVGGILICQFLF